MDLPNSRLNWHVFNVCEHGSVADGKTENTQAIQTAIDMCGKAGGGVVYFPPGDYLTGTIELADNVTLYIESGATLWGSSNRIDYEHGCLIYAEDALNVAIRGRGAVDGKGTSFWKRQRGRWIVGEWRPNRLIQFVRCENLLVEDVTLRNSPSWTLHPVDCDRVTVRGISILNGVYEDDGPNTDGINPDGCSRVRISDCYIQTGDDSIVLKVTDRPGGNTVCRDVTVTNCVLVSSETALKIGSESYGEFRNIAFSNCTVEDAGCGVGLWMRDGGLIDGWVVTNISMTLKDGGQPIYFWSWKRTEDTPWGTVKNVTISNVVASADGCIFISGVDEKHMQGITLENIRIFMQGGRGRREKFHSDPPYPFTVWGHRRSPYDIFCRYVDDLKLRNIHVTWNTPEKAEWGSAIRCWHARDVEIDGFVGRQASSSDAPAIWLKDVKGAFIHNCRPPKGTGTFLRIDKGSEAVTLVNNDLNQAERTVQIEPNVDPRELFENGNRVRPEHSDN